MFQIKLLLKMKCFVWDNENGWSYKRATTEKYADHGQEKWVTQLLVDKLHFPDIKKSQADNEEKNGKSEDEEEEEVLPF